MKKVFTFLAISYALFSNAQDPYFLNTNQSLVNLNPSFAGSNGGVRNQASYRSQWPALSANYVTYQNCFDFYLKRLHAGIAVSASMDDVAHGTLKSNMYSLTYAQHLSFAGGDLKVIPSLQIGYGMKILDRDNLHFGAITDPRYGFVWNYSSVIPNQKTTYFNMSAGLLVNYKKDLYFGASVFNINQPDVGTLPTEKIPYRLSIHASYNFKISEKARMQAFYRSNFQSVYSYSQLAVNTIFKNRFIAGLGYMTNNIAIINAGLRMECLTLQAGYDIGIRGNQLGTGSWELHASFNFPDKEKFNANQNFENY